MLIWVNPRDYDVSMNTTGDDHIAIQGFLDGEMRHRRLRVAPCQCFSSGANQTTSLAGFPQSVRLRAAPSRHAHAGSVIVDMFRASGLQVPHIAVAGYGHIVGKAL
jgi:hypothetical protein